MMGLVVFSDLDGTLLDHDDYSHDAAQPALAALKERGAPVVLCSSKTRAEILPLWYTLGLKGPFIAENGGGVFIPREHRLAAEPGWQAAGPGWRVRRLGLPIEEVRERFAGFKDRFGARGFGDLSDDEVAGLTGLSRAQASLARRREFNEPVVLPEPEAQADEFAAAAREAGLETTRGGRFFHLLAGGDKGKAVRQVAELFRLEDPELLTMALGDAQNDLSMLAMVDRPVLVARPDGSHAQLELPGLARQALPGPAGWSAAVLAVLAETAPGGA
jgi:mannosyl-3-phosphoglycerate phosphatase